MTLLTDLHLRLLTLTCLRLAFHYNVSNTLCTMSNLIYIRFILFIWHWIASR